MSSKSRDTVLDYDEKADSPSSTETILTDDVRDGNGSTSPSCTKESFSEKKEISRGTLRSDDTGSTDACPICFNPAEEYVSGLCRHSLCVGCMEVVLNANADVVRWPPPAAVDTHLCAPTLGRCPICRSMLSLFDIVSSKTLEPMYPPDTDSWKPKTNHDEHHSGECLGEGRQQCLLGELENDVIPSLSQSLMSSLTISAPPHPLENAIYIPFRGVPGELSFHWDWEKLSHDSEKNMIQRPFLNLSLAVRRQPEFWRLENQSLPPRIMFMEEGCHFHEPSRTFHGTVLWPIPFKGSYEWDIIFGFSKDYRFISTGRIHHKRGRQLKPGDVPGTYNTEERELCKHPMDGRWTVVWKNRDGEECHDEIHVINNEFKQSGWSFYFNFQDPTHIFVQWPRSRHRQIIVEGVDLITQPLGPPVGQRILWETTDSNAPGLVWIRQTAGPVPVEKVHHYGAGRDKFLYQRLDVELADSIPKYNGSSLWGNIFTKRMCVGSASYHFLSPTESYISYRHPACRDLPPLDDGSPLPTRVNFHNLDWKEEERKLSATIEWEKDFGTSWNDNVRWKLTMYFDTEYMIILKGGLQVEWSRERRARSQPPRPQPRHRPAPVPVYVPPPTPEETTEAGEDEEEEPDRNEEWVMSGYGHDQLYLNAACLERYREEDDEYEYAEVDYRGILKEHQKRLEKEGATKRSIGFLSHLFEIAENDPDANPIDFLIL